MILTIFFQFFLVLSSYSLLLSSLGVVIKLLFPTDFSISKFYYFQSHKFYYFLIANIRVRFYKYRGHMPLELAKPNASKLFDIKLWLSQIFIAMFEPAEVII